MFLPCRKYNCLRTLCATHPRWWIVKKMNQRLTNYIFSETFEFSNTFRSFCHVSPEACCEGSGRVKPVVGFSDKQEWGKTTWVNDDDNETTTRRRRWRLRWERPIPFYICSRLVESYFFRTTLRSVRWKRHVIDNIARSCAILHIARRFYAPYCKIPVANESNY